MKCYASKPLSRHNQSSSRLKGAQSVVPALSLPKAALETHRIVKQQSQSFHYLEYLFL